MTALEIIQKMLDEEKNAINRMYLNEILMKYKKFDSIAEKGIKKEKDLIRLTEALNNLINDLNSQKYKYNKKTKSGFNKNSPIFSPIYIYDLITLFLESKKLLNIQGCLWGYQNIPNSIFFNPRINFSQKDEIISLNEQEEILTYSQKLDLNIRISGKKKFEKHQINYPLVSIHAINSLNKTEFLKLNNKAFTQKKSFPLGKIIIIAETIENKYNPELENSDIDCIILLKNQKSKVKQKINISADIIKTMKNIIYRYITNSEQKHKNILENGILEKNNL